MGDPPPPKHDHVILKFPDGFLWGAATSAFQVEGGNTNADWWVWEQKVRNEENRSGQAADQYLRYKEDFTLAKELGHNAHRLSIEWSRVEPEEGRFDEDQINHYKSVLKTLKNSNLAVMLTLHHFTNPAWFASLGGWENGKSVYYFERFLKKVVPELAEYVDLWITINEPGIYTWAAYLVGVWPPQKINKLSALKVFWNLAAAHKKAYKIIHQTIPTAQVGLAHNVMSFDIFHRHSLLEALFQWAYDVWVNHLLYKLTGNTHDFLGLNYYYNQYLSFNRDARFPSMVEITKIKKDVSDLGWEIHPEGIFDVLVDFSDYHLPIYITENGLPSTNDDRRVRFLLSYLKEIYHAISFGVDVKGYFHWSLIDNFEWASGFDPRFGLVEIDYMSQKRTPRPSAYVYREIIKHNGIPHKLLKLSGHGISVEEVIELKNGQSRIIDCEDCMVG